MTARNKRNSGKTRPASAAPLGNGQAGQSLAATLLLGDVVYRNNGGGMYRLTDCGDGSYDLLSWSGEGWSFLDNIDFESARMRLKNSWEVYARAAT